MEFDIAIIGGGPGGYACAIRASQLGLKTALVEKRSTIGGTCVNIGCIPSKALLDSSEHYHRIAHGLDDHGIKVKGFDFDFSQMMARKERVVKELTDGLAFLMKKNRITVLTGSGTFQKESDGSVSLRVDSQSEPIRAKKYVIATGSQSAPLKTKQGAVPIDGKVVVTSEEALSLPAVPKKLIVIGGGVIGLELGSVYSRLGSEVSIIEFLPDILPPLDRQLRDAAKRALTKQGLTFYPNHEVTGIEPSSNEATVTVVKRDSNEAVTLNGDTVLVAVGRLPYTDGLGLETIGLECDERGFLPVDPESRETKLPGIYAIGDVTHGAMLAHRAEEEGIMVAEVIAGKAGHVNYDTLPFVVYTWPEIAWVGKSEETLKAEGIEVNTGKFLFRPNGRAKAMNEPDGIVKVIADKTTDRVLGVFIVGPFASELIGEAVIAMEFGASSEDIARSFHAHPTLSEVIKEASLDVDKRSIHS